MDTTRYRPLRFLNIAARALLCALILTFYTSALAAQPLPRALPSRGPTNTIPTARVTRTNQPPAKAPVLKGPVPGGTNSLAGTNAVAAATGTNLWSKLNQKFQEAKNNPMFYSAAAVGVCLLLAVVLGIRAWSRRRSSRAPTSNVAAIAKTARKGQVNVHSCNVLQVTEDSRRLWSFDARGRGFALNREHSGIPGQKLPQGLVARDWRSLFQRKVNVAWLPPEHVFLKIIQLPRSTFEETLSMVELQVEKLSPMPLAQVVWGIQVLPQSTGNLDTIVVMIVSRSIVEELLGRLENEGYLPDRLELPLLDQLQATPVSADGAYIHPGLLAGKNTALVAWWHEGVLQNLSLINLPPTDRAANLREQLSQMTWAGELEGWLTANPGWFLVAEASVAAEWEPAIREAIEQPVEILAPLSLAELAVRTASRAAKAETGTSLMPAEFAKRFQQQFVDRLWMRGLGAVLAIYIVGVLIYFVALNVAGYRTRAVEQRVESLGLDYTNALQSKAQSRLLQDRMDLKFAALDCWATVSKLLPEGITLDSMNFSDGKRLTLMGSAPTDQTSALTDFEDAMRKATVNGQPLFDLNRGDNVSYNAMQNMVVWSLNLELKRTEAQ